MYKNDTIKTFNLTEVEVEIIENLIATYREGKRKFKNLYKTLCKNKTNYINVADEHNYLVFEYLDEYEYFEKDFKYIIMNTIGYNDFETYELKDYIVK